jgi:hypothetical protein
MSKTISMSHLPMRGIWRSPGMVAYLLQGCLMLMWSFQAPQLRSNPCPPLPAQGLLSAHRRQTARKVLFQSRTTLLLVDPRCSSQHMLCLHPSIARIHTKSPLRQGETLLMTSPYYPKRKKILKMMSMCHQRVCIHHSSVLLQGISAPRFLTSFPHPDWPIPLCSPGRECPSLTRFQFCVLTSPSAYALEEVSGPRFLSMS